MVNRKLKTSHYIYVLFGVNRRQKYLQTMKFKLLLKLLLKFCLFCFYSSHFLPPIFLFDLQLTLHRCDFRLFGLWPSQVLGQQGILLVPFFQALWLMDTNRFCSILTATYVTNQCWWLSYHLCLQIIIVRIKILFSTLILSQNNFELKQSHRLRKLFIPVKSV